MNITNNIHVPQSFIPPAGDFSTENTGKTLPKNAVAPGVTQSEVDTAAEVGIKETEEVDEKALARDDKLGLLVTAGLNYPAPAMPDFSTMGSG